MHDKFINQYFIFMKCIFLYKTHLMVADHFSFIMIIWSDFIKMCFKLGPISNKVHMCTITSMLNMKQNITSLIIYVLNSHVSSVDYDFDHSIIQYFGTIGLSRFVHKRSTGADAQVMSPTHRHAILKAYVL